MRGRRRFRHQWVHGRCLDLPVSLALECERGGQLQGKESCDSVMRAMFVASGFLGEDLPYIGASEEWYSKFTLGKEDMQTNCSLLTLVFTIQNGT